MDKRTLLDFNAIAYMADRYGEFTKESSAQIINWAENQNGDVFYTREGREFIKRLYAINRGKSFEKFCVICGKPARNGVVCNGCVDHYIDIDEDMDEDDSDHNRQTKKKSKKPFIIAGIVLLVLISAAAGADKNKKNDEKKVSVSGSDNTENVTSGSVEIETSEETLPAAQNAAVQETAEKDEYVVGDEIITNDLRIVYVSSGEYTTDNDFLKPQDGNKYIFIELYFENLSTSDKGVTFYDFEGYADGYSASQFYSIEPSLSATLSAGRFTTGKVAFEVPNNAANIEVEYKINWVSDKKIKFRYDGEKNSGFAAAANTEASENAYKVGDTLSTKAFNITYIQCFEDKSYNEYLPPKDGYKFYTCELEFENITDRDQIVSGMLEFDCYADGQACEQSFFRDDLLSATLSAGRKAKGTVTFEVPEDATSVELECETNIWTSNRLVFTIK